MRLYNPGDPSKALDLDLMVDTGSTYTWIKRARLNGLGLKPTGKRAFRTIEGKLVEGRYVKPSSSMEGRKLQP
jgi:hypothetical protein